MVALLAFSVLSNSNAQQATNSTSDSQEIVYSVKFMCGTISDNEGPIRPGHYDTSISILNKKIYPVGILWDVVVNDGPTSTPTFKSIESEKAIGFSCKDIKGVLGIDTNKIFEGFTFIRVPLTSIHDFNNTQIVQKTQPNTINVLDVQAFYTSNALETLPQEIIDDKISFYIIHDESNKIPREAYEKLLDVTVPSTINEISDSEAKVKSILAEKYALSKKEIDSVGIKIKDITIGVGTPLDDHAISLRVSGPRLIS